MKYILSVFITSLLAMQYNAGAQSFSAGLRTGVGNNLDVTMLRAGAIDKHWEKELFLRYESKKRLAFELGGTHYSDAEAGIWHNSGCIMEYEPLFFEAPTHENLLTYTRYNMVDVSLGAQYGLSCPYLQEHCPLMKNFKSYLGVVAVGTFGKVTTWSTDRRLSDGDVTTTQRTDTDIYNLFFGLSHTAQYSFGNFFVTTAVSYIMSTASYYGNGDPTPNSKLSLRAGIGYRFRKTH